MSHAAEDLAVLVTRREEHIDAAAMIWAAATAARERDPDVATLAESRPLIEATLAQPRSALVVLLDDRGDVLAFASVEQASQGAHVAKIARVAVDPDVWGRGIGAALMRALPERLRELGFRAARLSVYVENARAVALYENAGWQPSGAIGTHPKSGKPERYFELGI